MDLLELKTVRIGDKEFPIKETTRSKIEFETLSGISYFHYVTNFRSISTENQFQYLYCIAKAGAKAKGEKFEYSFDEFIAFTDDHYSDTLTNFFEAITPKSGGEGKKQGKK